MTSPRVPSPPADDRTVRISRSFNTTLAAAFDAWINPDSLARWFGPPGYRAEVLTHDLRIGGAWRFRMISDAGDRFHHFGSFVAIEPPHTLAFTWASEEQVEGWRDETGNPTLVTVSFGEHAHGVTIGITHERLQSAAARRALTHGWGDGLDDLQRFLESAG